ncbi:MAG: hypothetical protein [Caudoviricetes sp.]|nr:MAG: hypothetical protein [Caudoviricetes sp.]
MAALTWRDVQAPDFRGTLMGLSQAGNQLNQAFDGASRTLANWDKSQNEGTNQQVLLNALQYTDPEAYKAALQSGAITAGVDPKRLNSQTLATLGSRAGDLLDQSIKGQALGASTYNQDRRVQGDASMDAAREGLLSLSDAYRSGDQNRVNQVMEQYGPQLSQLEPGKVQEFLKGGQGLERGAIGNSAAGFENNVAQRNDAEGRAAADAFTDIRRSSLNADDARALVEQGNYTPAVRNRLNQLLAAGGLDPYGNAPSTGGTAANTGGFVGSIPFPETKNYVQSITAQSGQVTGTNSEKAEKLLPFLIKQESGGDPTAVSVKGARGVTQVMPATGSNPGYGVAPMKNQSVAEQTRFGKDYLTAMLNKYDGNIEKALAAYNAGPGAVDGWTTASENRAVTQDVGERFMQNTQQGGAATDLASNLSSTAKPYEVVNKLVAEDGPYAKGDKGKLTDAINRIMREANVNAAQAGDILARNPEGSTVFRNLIGAVTGNQNTGGLLADTRINDAAVQQEVEQARSGETGIASLGQQALADTGQGLRAAQAAASNALAAYNAVLVRSQTQPGLRAQLPRYKAAADQAKMALDLNLAAQRANPNAQARRVAAPVNEPVSVQSANQRSSAVEIPRYRPEDIMEFNN